LHGRRRRSHRGRGACAVDPSPRHLFVKTPREGAVKCGVGGRGGYFVMGDNRAQSCDSRAWGSITRTEVIGNVVKIVGAG
jgi:hypothetical protein